jgi:hypothetical protein
MAITQIEITDTATLIAAARQVLLGFGKTAYWFRGHACVDWTLVPSVHRSYDSKGERNLLARFRLAAPTRYAKCPEMRDYAGWITLMQHFGLPTRLLDWTGSLLTAAYFAVSHEPKPGPGAIWVLSPGELNLASSHKDSSTFLLYGSNVQDLLREAFTGTPSANDVIAVLGQDLDLRMTIQMGAYTLHGSDEPLETRVGAEKYLAKFVIPEQAKATLKEELWVLGVRRGTLFPDLANLAQELTQDTRLIPRRMIQEQPNLDAQ